MAARRARCPSLQVRLAPPLSAALRWLNQRSAPSAAFLPPCVARGAKLPTAPKLFKLSQVVCNSDGATRLNFLCTALACSQDAVRARSSGLSSAAFDGQRGRVLRVRTPRCALSSPPVRTSFPDRHPDGFLQIPTHPKIGSLLKNAFLHSEESHQKALYEVRYSSDPASSALF